jgi:transcriptional regulator with XRE-family HTH domain
MDTAQKIREARKRRKLTQSQLGEAIGLSHSAISQWEKPDDPTLPKGQNLINAANVLGVTPEWLMDAPQNSQDFATLTPIQLDKSVPVKGVVQAGHWMPADELLSLEGDPVRVSSREFGGKYTYFALQVRGNSMDQFFKEGDFVICVPYSEYPKDLMGGEFVVVQRSRNGEAEATVKQIEKRGDDVWLFPRSMDPTHVPIKYEPQDQMFDDGGDDPIKILAVVRGHTGTFW